MNRYVVTENIRITPTVQQITMQASDPSEVLAFEAGQYAGISFRRFGRRTPVRTFSILSSPNDPAMLQFAMRVGGNYTKAVSNIRVGETVEVMGPFGEFGTPSATAKQYFIAGGIGITPFISMLREASENKSTTETTLIYSSQTQADVPFAQELVNLAAANPNLKVIFAVTTCDTSRFSKVNVVSGRINAEILDSITGRDYAQSAFYLCGPPKFMGAITQLLGDDGVSPHRITTEAFSQTKGAGKSLSRRVYWLTAASMILGTSMVSVVDLHATSEKAEALNYNARLVQEQAAAAAATPTPTATPDTSSSSDVTATPTPVPTATPQTRVIYMQQPSQVS